MPINHATTDHPTYSTDPAKSQLQFKRGTLQLWQFLVYLLEEKNATGVIQWVNKAQSTFKLCDPEEVARQWGAQKNRQTMNYDKLSRSLRYYYEKGIMQKVSGERYVYKFLCNTNLNFNDANISIVDSTSERKPLKQRNSMRNEKFVVSGKVKSQQHQQPQQPQQAHRNRYVPYSAYSPYGQPYTQAPYEDTSVKQEVNEYTSPKPAAIDYKLSPSITATSSSSSSLMTSPIAGLAAQYPSNTSTPCSLQYQNAFHIHHYHLYQPQAQQQSQQQAQIASTPSYFFPNYYTNSMPPTVNASDVYDGHHSTSHHVQATVLPLKTQCYMSSPVASSIGSTSLATPSSMSSSSSYYQPDISSTYSGLNDSLNTQYNDFWY
jgi:hypothetical protein